MATVIKKSLEQKIADAKKKLVQLEAKKAEKGLEKDSAGMEKLLAEVEIVCQLNKCKTIDVVRSIARIKKTGAKIVKDVKARKPKAAKETVPKKPK